MITKFSVKKPYTVLVSVIIVLVFAIVSFTKMTPDLFPKIEMPYVAVVTTYPGASSQEVEETVTIPMEQQMASLENLKNITSTSSNSVSFIFLEFSQDAKLDTLSVDIRDKIDMASGNFNDMVQKPMIMKINPSMIPVTVATVSQKGKDIVDTSELLSEELLRKLEGIEGVASISTNGMIGNEIHISISDEKVEKINKRINNSISSGIENAKSSIQSQIDNAQSGIEGIEQAKEKIKDAQDLLLTQSDNIKKIISSLKTLNATKEGLQNVNNGIKEKIEAAMPPNATPEEIENEAMKNPIYASNKKTISEIEKSIETIIKKIKPMGNILKSLGVDINTLDTLQGVIKAEESFNTNLKKSQNDLNNSMAEMIGNEALLKSANMQLQSTIMQMEQQGAAALNENKITSFLNIKGISQIISAQNFRMPAGYVSDDGKDVLVTVGDKFSSIDELKNMVILDMGINGVEPILLSDISDISYLTSGNEGYSKINGEDGIILMFNKQSDYSITEVANNIQDKFKQLSTQYGGVEFNTLSDQGDYIDMAVGAVLDSLILGGILSIIILFFFLKDIKPTLITAISIPISLMFAIVLMYFSGVSINIISLAGLSVGIGMLVDNSIVVIENIYRMRSLGYSKIKAAVSGAGQVANAITASTLTTICVFAPIVFVEGMTKIIFKDMALTVTYSLVASLMVALTIVPALSSVTLKNIKTNTVLGNNSKLVMKYKEIMSKLLKKKILVLATAFLLLIVSCAVTISKGFEYMPEMSAPQISATINMNEKNTKEECYDFYDEISTKLLKIDGVKTVGSMLSSNNIGISAAGSEDFRAISFYILLDEKVDVDKKRLESEFEKLCLEKEAEFSISSTTDMSAMTGSSGVKINISSDDLDKLRNSTLEVEKALGDIKGLSEISSIDEKSADEISITIDREKAMQYGLTVAQVFSSISERLSEGASATTISYDNKNTDVIVSTDVDNITYEELMSQKIPTGNGQEYVVLSEIANADKGRSIDEISRINQKRTETVTATVDEGFNITKLTNEAMDKIENIDMPSEVEVEFEGENEEIMEAMNQLFLMFVLGILLIYLVMVAQFQSLLSPFIVMFTVPLAITGAMLALFITGFEVSVVAMVGIIMLMGVIVNNAIVLIDYINQRRRDGLSKAEAIVEAGAVRMRPVLMTAITTVLGLLPMAIGIGDGAEMIQPVAIVCIGGLVYGTFMTLVVIPIMYDILGPKKIRKFSQEELTVDEG